MSTHIICLNDKCTAVRTHEGVTIFCEPTTCPGFLGEKMTNEIIRLKQLLQSRKDEYEIFGKTSTDTEQGIITKEKIKKLEEEQNENNKLKN